MGGAMPARAPVVRAETIVEDCTRLKIEVLLDRGPDGRRLGLHTKFQRLGRRILEACCGGNSRRRMFCAWPGIAAVGVAEHALRVLSRYTAIQALYCLYCFCLVRRRLLPQ